MRHFCLLLAIVFAAPLQAQDYCRAQVNATDLVVDRASFAERAGGPSLRERALNWPSRRLDSLRGRVPACDSATLIAYLSEIVAAEDIDAYCLAEDPEQGFLLVPGARNFRGRCTRTTCERVRAASDSAVGITGLAADTVTRRDVEGGQTRMNALLHASGAAILSGSAASLASGLSGVASGVATALAAPAVAGAAAVSVVAVGGAVYLCRDDTASDAAPEQFEEPVQPEEPAAPAE